MAYQLLAGFSLGALLRKERKCACLTQAELARRAGLAERTVRLLEQSGGNLGSWYAVLRVLGLEVAGRHLPSGDGKSFGQPLATLRSRRGLGVRELAQSVGVSPSPLVALERDCGAGRLATLERVLVVLGAGAYLAPRGRSKAFYSHWK